LIITVKCFIFFQLHSNFWCHWNYFTMWRWPLSSYWH